MSQKLDKAREYERIHAQEITDEERPAFHLTPYVGWMNDPNGFSYYKGEYHMFYQYYPYDTHWGPMHWGHAKSKDMYTWEFLPAAIAPDEKADMEGCFSGSAITMPDGRQALLYTGCSMDLKEDGTPVAIQPDGNPFWTQAQCVAFGDGVDYEKVDLNPVMDIRHLPEGNSKYDFRDPKVVRHEDGTYRCYAVNRNKAGVGAFLQFKSEDMLHWELKSVMAESHGELGRMWECPDFFELDGKYVLLASAQDMLAEGLEYISGNGTFVMIGSYDDETGVFTRETDQTIDYGIDFYAPQTVVTPDGRRVMIGWMQNWDAVNLRTNQPKWYGQMSMPRELYLKDGRLCQRPTKEIEHLYGEKVEAAGLTVKDGSLTVDGVKGRRVDLTVKVHPAVGTKETHDTPAKGSTEIALQEVYKQFGVRFAEGENVFSEVRVTPEMGTIDIDRRFSGTRRAISHTRTAALEAPNGEVTLRIILDRYSAEIFVNDGEKALTMTLITDQAADGISFYAKGEAAFDVEMYSLEN